MFSQFGKILILAGAAIMLTGIILAAGDKIPFLGKLPGDFTFKVKNTTVYFPLITGLVISIIITILINIFGRRG